MGKINKKLKSGLKITHFRLKKNRKPEHIDESILQLFKLQRSRNVYINGPILVAKTRKFAVVDSTLHSTSPYRFWKRFGESGYVPAGIIDDWLTTVFTKIQEGYKDEERSNVDETRCFVN